MSSICLTVNIWSVVFLPLLKSHWYSPKISSEYSFNHSSKILDNILYATFNNFFICVWPCIISVSKVIEKKPNRCKNNNLLFSKISSTCFGKSFANLQVGKTEIYSMWCSVLQRWIHTSYVVLIWYVVQINVIIIGGCVVFKLFLCIRILLVLCSNVCSKFLVG